jgi:hypothetical protein
MAIKMNKERIEVIKNLIKSRGFAGELLANPTFI